MVRLNQLSKELVLSHDVDVDKYLNWLDNRIVFNDEPLLSAFNKIERWYGVEIHMQGVDLEGIEISAQFEDASIHEVMNVIKLAVNLNYDMSNGNIYLSR